MTKHSPALPISERGRAAHVASVRARLKQRADAEKIPFDLALTRFGLERLLYRLSVSRHADDFILKGALLLALWYDSPTRPTRDADFLGFGLDDADSVRAVFEQLCAVPANDGLIFDATSVNAVPIRENADYGGIRVTMRAELAGARIALHIDIGYGDAVTPEAMKADYPVLLDDLPAPRLRVYAKHTMIAEKLQALTVLGLANSRMKDYFDLWLLLRDDAVDAGRLRAAIRATFARRSTPVPKEFPIGLRDEFAADPAKQTQWLGFVTRNRLQAPSLAEVVVAVRAGFHRRGVM